MVGEFTSSVRPTNELILISLYYIVVKKLKFMLKLSFLSNIRSASGNDANGIKPGRLISTLFVCLGVN